MIEISNPLDATCSRCGTHTDLYKPNCDKCGAILRDKVPNIDLWDTIQTLIANPKSAFLKVIFAEKKNYLFLILLFLLLKNSLIYQAINAICFGIEYLKWSDIKLTEYGGFGIVFIFGLISMLVLKFRISRIKTMQILALMVYSQIPIVLSLIVLSIPEFVIFGKYIFYKNPNIFEIHPVFSYIFLFFEGAFYVWAFLLMNTGLRLMNQNKRTSFALSLILFAIVNILPYILLINIR